MPKIAYPQDKYVTVNGFRLHYLDWGNENKQLMFLGHGFQDCAHNWDSLAESMSRDYHVLALDHRGHGDSQWSPEAAYKLQDYVADITGFVEELELDNMVYIGHSAGGRNAMVYVSTHQEKVESLVIVDIDPMGSNPQFSKWSEWYQSEPEEWESLEAVVERLGKRAPRAPEEILRRHAYHMTRELPGGRRIWKRDRAILAAYNRPDIWDYYRKISCPTLLLRGEHSTILTPEVAQKMAEELPGVNLVQIKNAGHWCLDDNPGDSEVAVRDFLGKLR